MKVFLHAYTQLEGENIMEKFQADLTKVAEMFDPDRIPLKGNEHRLVRVAFDLFRVDGDESDDLWQIQADDDGNEFLFRTYTLEGEEDKVAEASWSVLADKKYANLTVSFQGVPITRLACKDFGAETAQDGKSLQGVLFKKLASDGAFVTKLLESLPLGKQAALKEAGLLQRIKDWLQSKDITDPIVADIKALVEQSEPGYKEMFEKEDSEPVIESEPEQKNAYDMTFRERGFDPEELEEDEPEELERFIGFEDEGPEESVEEEDIEELDNLLEKLRGLQEQKDKATDDEEKRNLTSAMFDLKNRISVIVRDKFDTDRPYHLWHAPGAKRPGQAGTKPPPWAADDGKKKGPSVPVGDLANEDQEWSLAYLDLHFTKTAHCGECEQDAWGHGEKIKPDFHKVFNSIRSKFLNQHGVKMISELPEAARAEMFNEIDKAWPHENEAAMALEAKLRIAAELDATPDFYAPGSTSSGVDVVNMSDDVEQDATPPPIPTEVKFDFTDVESGEGEWAPEGVEKPEDTKFVDPESVKEIIEDIEKLSPEDKQALENYLKS